MKPACCLAVIALLAGGCSREGTAELPRKHEHHPPHGGTPVVLGDEAYHLEFVRDAAAGRMDFYVLDGEMENFIRIAAPSIEVAADADGRKRPLVFRAVANPETGETVGDTSQFEAEADWLKSTASFDAVLAEIDVRGSRFAHVGFNFPKGNDTD
jgi:hypothetical protein